MPVNKGQCQVKKVIGIIELQKPSLENMAKIIRYIFLEVVNLVFEGILFMLRVEET